MEDAKKFASTEKLAYFETSAKTGEGVEEAVIHLVKECLKKQKSADVEVEGFELDPK